MTTQTTSVEFTNEKLTDMRRLATNHAEEGRGGLSHLEIADAISYAARRDAERIVLRAMEQGLVPASDGSFGLQGGASDDGKAELNMLLDRARGRELACLSRCVDALIA